MENSIRFQQLNQPLWQLLLRAGFTLLRRRREFGAPRQFQHELPAPSLHAIGAYQQHFGYPAVTVPLCFYYPLLQRAQLAGMLQCSGLVVAGLIHTDNTLESLQPQTPAQLSAGGCLKISTVLSTESNAQGRYLLAEQQLWQQGKLLIQASSRYLISKAPRTTAPTAPAAPAAPIAATAVASITPLADAARRYAKLSGDYNPIHLWQWSARLFGQRQVILHGMATAAMLCQVLTTTSPVPNQPAWLQTLQLRFRKPVLPGTTLTITQQADGHYQLHDGARLCLEAELKFSDAAPHNDAVAHSNAAAHSDSVSHSDAPGHDTP